MCLEYQCILRLARFVSAFSSPYSVRFHTFFIAFFRILWRATHFLTQLLLCILASTIAALWGRCRFFFGATAIFWFIAFVINRQNDRRQLVVGYRSVSTALHHQRDVSKRHFEKLQFSTNCNCFSHHGIRHQCDRVDTVVILLLAGRGINSDYFLLTLRLTYLC